MALQVRRTLAELRRRKVYRAAIVYAAAAFVVWQVADLAFPYLGLPDSAVTLVLALTILGFPVALVLAWSYELRPEDPAPPLEAPEPTMSGEAPVHGSRGVPDLAGPGPATGASPVSTASASPPPSAIAVLPFDNMSPEPESEYFADGISEELTHALGRVRSLRVAARTSAFAFKGQRMDVRQIGDRLNVSWVVEGSVRRSGDRLRVTAQLVDTHDGYHLWSSRFEREMDDVFAIQDEIVEAVLASLLERLGWDAQATGAASEPPTLPRTADLDAYDRYLRGRHEMRRFDGRSVTEAVNVLEQAVELDGSFAPAQAGLAEALTMQAIGFSQGRAGDLLPRAREAAERALALDPDLPAAHVARALSSLYYDWDFPGARAELERALALNPSSADAHRWAEFYWTYVEYDYERALGALERARALDPMDPRIRAREGTVEYLFGHHDRAEAIFRDLLATEPGLPIATLGLLDTLHRQGKTEAALEVALGFPADAESPGAALGLVGMALGLGGAEARARANLETLMARQADGEPSLFWAAMVHLGLREIDEAFDLLESACERREGNLLYLAMVPRVQGFQDDPRFASLLRRMGLGHLLHAADAGR